MYELATEIEAVNAELYRPTLLGLLAARQQDQDRQDLAHLLEELVGCHTQLQPRSLFGLTRKASAGRTGAQLYALLPGFVAHLKRRDEEMLILPPLLRRWGGEVGKRGVADVGDCSQQVPTQVLLPADVCDHVGGPAAAAERQQRHGGGGGRQVMGEEIVT